MKISKSGAKAKAWKAFARFIKVNHADKFGMCHCVTCGLQRAWNDSDIHAGHFVAGRGNAVLFDEDLVRPQCCGCNMFRGGEQTKFALYFKKWEHKTDEQIEEYLNRRNKIVKYSTGDYLRICEEYNNKADAIISLKSI